MALELNTEIEGEANVQTGDENNTLEAGANVRGGTETTSQGIGQELNVAIEAQKMALTEGNYTGPFGQALAVKQLSLGLRELRSNNVSARTALNITTETKPGTKRVTLKVHLSTGSESEIKVMPDHASDSALVALQVRACSPENGCTIELKEVGKGTKVRAAYEVQAEKEVKVLGLFRARANLAAHIDAETGETLDTSKPWWAHISTSA